MPHRRPEAVRLDPDSPAFPPQRYLAVDGADVGSVIGVEAGAEVGAALRWLEAQVAQNPQLNTPQALTALLRFAPTSAWQPASRDQRAVREPRQRSRPRRALRHRPTATNPVVFRRIESLG